MHGFSKIYGYQHEYSIGCQSSIIHTSVDIHINIQAGISMQGHSAMDIRKQWISINGYWIRIWTSVFNYPCFYGYPWISMDIHVLTCYGFSIQGCLSMGRLATGRYRQCKSTNQISSLRVRRVLEANSRPGGPSLSGPGLSGPSRAVGGPRLPWPTWRLTGHLDRRRG